jgi:predicted enzyme related to lactoylglutathione lyase
MPIPSHAKGMPPAWFPWVTVDNVEATVKQAVQLGGKVLVEPKDIQEVGRFAVIQDPQGAAITIIRAPFLGLIGSPRDALGS